MGAWLAADIGDWTWQRHQKNMWSRTGDWDAAKVMLAWIKLRRRATQASSGAS